MANAAALMIQATSSHAGKSLLVAGLCRAFRRRGLAVRPFKPQNMSNNAAVALDGGEIGRAQALQARACGVAPSRHMNPILLKPEGERGAQLVVQGQVTGSYDAREYHLLKPRLMPQVLESFAAVARDADLVIVEGAGSPAEINLRDGDIANMGFAHAARVPVLLAADIERGGVIAQLVGTVSVLDPADRACLEGWLVNKFRGDPSLFQPAVAALEVRTGLPGLGIIPWLDAARDLPKEDALGLAELARRPGTRVRVAVPRLPRIANFDDLEPLAHEPDLDLLVLEPGTALPGDIDLVLLPGSKATRADLATLFASGWDIDIRAHVRRGGRVIGLCGGYQMLGRWIADPAGLEGEPGTSPGLGLLAVDTVLAREKSVREVSGVELATGEAVRGYEIHLGRTEGPDTTRPMLRLEDVLEGAVSMDGRVSGCYLHGLFAADGFRRAFLARLGAHMLDGQPYEGRVEAALDAVARHLEAHLDLDRLLAIARRSGNT